MTNWPAPWWYAKRQEQLRLFVLTLVDKRKSRDESNAKSTWCLFASLLIGTFSTVLGGYIVARIAKNLPLFNACAVGVVGIAAAVLLGGQSESPW